MVSKVIALRECLVERLKLMEGRTLCYDLTIDQDELPGESKTAKCREPIAYLPRRDQLDRLITHLETSRIDLREALATIPGILPSETITGILKLSRMTLGTFEDGNALPYELPRL